MFNQSGQVVTGKQINISGNSSDSDEGRQDSPFGNGFPFNQSGQFVNGVQVNDFDDDDENCPFNQSGQVVTGKQINTA